MNRSILSRGWRVVLFLTMALIGTPAAAAEKETGMTPKATETKGAVSSGKVHVMSGKITAIDVADSTAVIAYPEGKKIVTVAGPLDPKAVLKKGGRFSRLEDFRAGEQVQVKWKTVSNGHRILMLAAKWLGVGSLKRSLQETWSHRKAEIFSV